MVGGIFCTRTKIITLFEELLGTEQFFDRNFGKLIVK